ncbi:type IV secretion system DNA-binding domain-containing protein [Burkholderia cenocepacia]|uniref:type IV secretion system DNA-binding domain-containing protein n=1 Tax=Burkholderia cenocepacia TaxID=95486 RepID=UPI000F5BCDB5|nr:type IV secretion system DNA-binding domain-containing protein [Burkholderia cenocepacia]
MESKEAVDVAIIGDAVVVTPGAGMSLAAREAMTSRFRRSAGEVILDREGTLCGRFYESDDHITNPYDERHRIWSALDDAGR